MFERFAITNLLRPRTVYTVPGTVLGSELLVLATSSYYKIRNEVGRST